MSETEITTTVWRGRYLILLFDCLLCFGLFFCIDIPSALQAYLQGQQNDCSEANRTKENSTCCTDCLGLGPYKYNTLYAVYSWTNALMVLPTAVLVDRTGIRLSGMLFTGIAVLGTAVFAVSALPPIRGSSAMYPLMICGRILLSTGVAPSRIVQDRTIAIWFRDRLAMAFGLVVMWYRIGSLLNFFVTANLAETFGMTYALFAGVAMSCLSFLASVCMALLDKHGCKKVGMTAQHQKSVDMSLTDIRDLKPPFWLICLMLTTYISFLIGFCSNITKYIQDKYVFSKTASSYMAGGYFNVCVIAAPVIGLTLDKIGKRAMVATAGALINFLVGMSILFTTLYPLIYTVLLGIGSTMIGVSLWPSIAHVVPLKVVGTANGIATFMLQLSGGILSLGIGQILGTVEESNPAKRKTKWTLVFILLDVYLGLCFVFGILLNIVDRKMGTNLNKRKVNSKELEDAEREPLLKNSSPDSCAPSIQQQ